MTRTKKIDGCQFVKTMKHYSAAICILLVITVLIISLSVVSSASPSVQAMESAKSQPQFKVDVAYAFVGKGPSEDPHSHFDEVPHYPESQSIQRLLQCYT